ncbi:MAG: diacylglycerol kinase family protein [Patescibacteria group bacterium]|nr:diacylglycerol kinase family protein [Patescibacteria group bacterium]
MNAYIYDDFLNKNRYRRSLNRVEIRLTDLGLNGKIIRLGAIKNIKEVIQAEIKNGIKNIIAVGNNETVNKVISAMITNKNYSPFQKDVLFSVIPIGGNNSIANSFGIKKEEDACNILLARRVKQIDVAYAGNNIFLNKAELISNDAIIEINSDYHIELDSKTNVKIINVNDDSKLMFKDKIYPNDDNLNLIVGGRNADNTFITSDHIKMRGTGEIILDESIVISLPSEMGIIQQKINIIVGKDRSFN